MEEKVENFRLLNRLYMENFLSTLFNSMFIKCRKKCGLSLSGVYVAGDVADSGAHFGLSLYHIFYLMNGRENGSMVSILKNCSYIVEREVYKAADKVDANMACNGDIFASALTFYLIGAYGEVSCGLLNYNVGSGNKAAHAYNVLHGSVYGLNIDLSVDYLAESGETLNNAFNLTDVALDAVGNILNNIVAQLHAKLTCLVADNGHAGLHIGGLNVNQQTAFKAGAETVVQLHHIHGRTVGGDDYLMACLVDIIEGMEEFFLSCFLTGNELDIVNQKEVNVSVFLAEFLGGAVFYGANHLIGEIVAFHIGNFSCGVVLVYGGANCQKKMGLAETGVTVYEKGVIGFAAGASCCAKCGCVSVLIALAYDEVIEGVAVHFGEGIAVLHFVAVFVDLVACKDDKLKVAGEKVAECGADAVSETLCDYALFEVGGGMDNEFSVLQIDGSAVGKPSVYSGACKLTGEYLHYSGPYIVDGIHIFNPLKNVEKLPFEQTPLA